MEKWKMKLTGMVFTLGLLFSLVVLIATPVMSSPKTVDFPPAGRDSTLENGLSEAFGAVTPDITEGIELTVFNREGSPAKGAKILVYSDVSQLPVLGHIMAESIVQTDENGFVFLDVPGGTYTLAIASNTDKFFMVKEGVTAPSSLTVSAADETVEVQVTAIKTNGTTPLQGAAVFATISAYWPMQAGTTNSTGQAVVYLTPYTYRDILIWDWDERYYLYEADVDITDTDVDTLEFDASLMPTGACMSDFVDFNSGAIVPFLETPNELSLGPIFNIVDGSLTLLSEGTYETSVFLYKDGAGQDTWEFWTRAQTIDIDPDDTVNVYAGGNFTIGVSTDKSVYDRGDNVTLNMMISDNFSNQILVSYIDATDSSEFNRGLLIRDDGKGLASPAAPFTDASIENNPTITIKKPDGSVFSELTGYYFYYYNFTLPVDADEGVWTANVSFDTGPHQGIIGSSTTFVVEVVPPEVTTLAADNITINSATLNGYLDSLGDYSSANVSFEWGIVSGVLDQETTPETVVSEGDFSADLTGLKPNTDYFFKARAVADGEVVYGGELDFTTPYFCGDVNSDGKVNMADVMILWYDIADYPSAGAWTISNEWAADVNCDGQVNMADVMILWYGIADYPSAGAWEVNCCE